MVEKRIQLTLMINPGAASAIEAIRLKYNPLQARLIPAHVTLCREEELGDLDQVLHNLNSLRYPPIRLIFAKPQRFANGKGVFCTAVVGQAAFQGLKATLLGTTSAKTDKVVPHLTLMHPRNSTCTDQLFEQLLQENLPLTYDFDQINLIAQVNGGIWKTLGVFPLS